MLCILQWHALVTLDNFTQLCLFVKNRTLCFPDFCFYFILFINTDTSAQTFKYRSILIQPLHAHMYIEKVIGLSSFLHSILDAKWHFPGMAPLQEARAKIHFKVQSKLISGFSSLWVFYKASILLIWKFPILFGWILFPDSAMAEGYVLIVGCRFVARKKKTLK